MSTTEPSAQPTNQPPAQPTVPPASPNAEAHIASSASEPRRLVRRTDDRMIAGVCSGLASHLGLDPTLVRVLAVLATVLGAGSVVIAYLVAWVLVPEDTDVRKSVVAAR
jgi:phage shock protein PspC (stress-responsive transcriptional regulator)